MKMVSKTNKKINFEKPLKPLKCQSSIILTVKIIFSFDHLNKSNKKDDLFCISNSLVSIWAPESSTVKRMRVNDKIRWF